MCRSLRGRMRPAERLTPTEDRKLLCSRAVFTNCAWITGYTEVVPG